MLTAPRLDPARARLTRAVALAATAWLAALAQGLFADLAAALVAFGAGVVVPIGLCAAGGAPRPGDALRGTHDLSSYAASLGAPLAVGSFFVQRGPLAAALAAVWLIATLAIGLAGALRLARRGLGPLEEVAIDVGHLYLPVGGVWLVASRGGMELLGFREPVVTFTANHFHFAGFAAPVVVGLLGRELGLRRAPDETGPLAPPSVAFAYGVAAPIVLCGVPLVAAGIQLSRMLEAPAAIFLGFGMLITGALLGLAAVRRLRAGGWVERVTGVLLLVAGLSLLGSMSLAVLFTTTGSATRGAGAPAIPFSTMVRFHGAANALGFALAAMLAFAVVPPPARVRISAIAWPRLLSRGFVGPDFFDRRGAVDPAREARGQIASLDRFAHAGFDPAVVSRDVRAFYERTADYELRVDAHWAQPFRVGARVWSWFARRALGQLELPVDGDSAARVETRIFAIDAERDGRTPPVHGYVRTYRDGSTTRANYVACYAAVDVGGRPHLSAAFPLPGCALVGILRFEDGPVPGSLVLTSRPRPGEGPAGEGMFLATPLGALRIPVDERIEVGPGLCASHHVRVMGLRCFRLEYAMSRTSRT